MDNEVLHPHHPHHYHFTTMDGQETEDRFWLGCIWMPRYFHTPNPFTAIHLYNNHDPYKYKEGVSCGGQQWTTTTPAPTYSSPTTTMTTTSGMRASGVAWEEGQEPNCVCGEPRWTELEEKTKRSFRTTKTYLMSDPKFPFWNIWVEERSQRTSSEREANNPLMGFNQDATLVINWF